MYAPVAQLDRVTDYESVGRGFESLPAYQNIGYPFRGGRCFFIVVRKIPADWGKRGTKFIKIDIRYKINNWTIARPL